MKVLLETIIDLITLSLKVTVEAMQNPLQGGYLPTEKGSVFTLLSLRLNIDYTLVHPTSI